MRSELYDAYLLATTDGMPDSDLIRATPLRGRPGDFISAGTQNQPVLLLSCKSAAGLVSPTISLKNITVEFGIRYRISTASEILEADFVVLSLRGSDLGLAEAFCLAAEALVSGLSPSPSTSEISKAVRNFVDLLSLLTLPSARAVAGLWGELWLISESQNPSAAMEAWHRNPSDRFDFSFSNGFVEIKATSRESRVHSFALEQLRNTPLPIRIVSMKLRRSEGGISIFDLVTSLHQLLSSELRQKLVKNVFGAIGNSVSEAADICYDASYARLHLQAISGDKVPCPLVSVHDPITAVRFDVNLDDSLLSDFMKSMPSTLALCVEL